MAATLLETFAYSDYSDFIATSGWTEVDPPVDGTVTFSPYYTWNLVAGDNDAVGYTRNVGLWAEDPATQPGYSILLAQFAFDYPVPSDSVGFNLAVVNEDLSEYVYATITLDAVGTAQVGIVATSGGSSMIDPTNSDLDFSGGSITIAWIKNTATGMVSCQILSGVTQINFDTGIWTGGTLNSPLWGMGASPITDPPTYQLSCGVLLYTYGGSGGGRTYYTPTVTGALGAASTQFSKRRV